MCVIRLERLYVLTKKKPVISKDIPETIGSLKTSSELPEYAAAAEPIIGPAPNQVAIIDIEHTVKDMFRPLIAKSPMDSDFLDAKRPTTNIMNT